MVGRPGETHYRVMFEGKRFEMLDSVGDERAYDQVFHVVLPPSSKPTPS